MDVRLRGLGISFVVVACLATSWPSFSWAAPPTSKENAKKFYQEAMSAYGLGNYAQAAELYEKAFALKADPALLYNAAQAHRIAGHADRAMELYRNYLRLFPMADQGAEAQRHIDSLQHPAATSPAPAAAIAPLATASAPPAANATMTTSAAPAPVATETASDRKVALPGADLTAQPAPADSRRSHTWVWVAAGAGVAVAAVVVLALVLGGHAQDPKPSLGSLGGGK